jgi:NADH:ubiquinone oxidoreductase subunit C
MNLASNNQQNQLPLILRNLKKAFDKNIQGPIILQEREYQATTKSNYLYDIAKFLAIRGVNKMAAINAWRDNKEIKLAYHFIAKIGTQVLDSKITIITFLTNDKKTIYSLRKIYKNARIFEEEISKEFDINFSEKK